MSGRELTAGWGWPGNAGKAHFFDAGDLTSLCGRWMYAGERDGEMFESKSDCAACRKRLAKRDERKTHDTTSTQEEA